MDIRGKDIKPSGMLKVSPNVNPSGKPHLKRERKNLSLSKITMITVSVMAVILISIVYLTNSNYADDFYGSDSDNYNGDLPENGINSEIPGLSDSEVCGRWSLTDYVENIEDFDTDIMNYKKYDITLYSHIYEFFEDKTAVIYPFGSYGEPETCVWINKDKFSILPDNADVITVSKIKKINGFDYMFAENAIPDIDSVTGKKMPGYYVFKRNKPKELYLYDDIRNKDMRNYDLSNDGIIMKSCTFNESTRFPAGKNKLPYGDNLQPGYILENGKNPGLGICELHKQGITGKGVNIAVIDEPLLPGHPEYNGKIAEYKDFGSGEISSMQGPAIASLLAGETVGTAPGVKIYYAAVPAWNSYDAEYYAKALDWLVEVNRTLPDGEKIRAVCVSPNPENPLPWINVDKYLESFQRAEKEGLLVLDCSDEHGFVIGACGYDFDNPEDVSLCAPKNMYRIRIASYHYDNIRDIYINPDEEDINEFALRAPVTCRTMAQAYDDGGGLLYQYQYNGKGQLSWAIPYVTGVLAMGWQVRPKLTSDEITEILFDTAYIDKRGNKYINPVEFIGYLRKN